MKKRRVFATDEHRSTQINANQENTNRGSFQLLLWDLFPIISVVLCASVAKLF